MNTNRTREFHLPWRHPDDRRESAWRHTLTKTTAWDRSRGTHTGASGRRAVRVVPLLALVLALGVPAFSQVPRAAAASATFLCTGDHQTYTVPPGVHSLTYQAGGATGAGPSGGQGGKITGTIPVNPGDVLTIDVGCTSGYGWKNGAPGGSGYLTGGANGGGATGIYLAGGQFPKDFPLVVAAGGGGTGGQGWIPDSDYAGGNGGVGDNCGAGGNGHGPGGGAGGTTCTSGTGAGGDSTAAGGGGGGGGGGYEGDGLGGSGGGLGGGGGGGGAGGASFADPHAGVGVDINPDPNPAESNGYVKLTPVLPAADLTVSTTATPTFTRAFTWGIDKFVDKTSQGVPAGSSALFHYIVRVTHDTGTDSGWQVGGTVTVQNPNDTDVSGVTITEAAETGATCTVTDGTNVTVPANGSVNRDYTCTYGSAPIQVGASRLSTATASWTDFGSPHTSRQGYASFSFGSATPTLKDNSVEVNDSMQGTLGWVSSTDRSPTAFDYPETLVSGDAGTCTDYPNTATFTTNDTNTSGSVSKTVTVCAQTNLFITADPQTMTYGGTVPSLTASYSGFINGDTSDSLSGTLSCHAYGPSDTTYSSPLSLSGSTAAGSYDIHCSGQSSPHYKITYVDGTLTIGKAQATITAGSPSMSYGDTTIPDVHYAVSNLQNGETSVSFTTSPTCVVRNSGDTADLTVSSSTAAGSYTTRCSGAVALNYEFTYVDGTFAINSATLTVKADDKTMTYGGTVPSFTASDSGFVSPDDSSVVTGLTCGATDKNGHPVSSTTPVGTYPITCSGATAPSRYAISYVAGTLTITQATPQISWSTPVDITYGTALSAKQLDATATSNGSSVAGTFVYTPAAGTVLNAGKGQTLSVSFTPTDTTDYTAATASVPINVTQAPFTITALDQHSTYGTTTTDLTLSSNTIKYDGFVNGDTAASLTTPAQLHTTAAKASPVGSYPITVDSAAAANYSITFVPGTLHVDPAPLTITPTNLTMTYKGTVPAYTWKANFVNGDTSAALTTQPTCVAKDGSGNPVSASTPAGVYTITCTGAVDPNYTISYKTGTLTVLYGTGGYLQPVNDTAHGETCGSPCPMSIFKAGQTIPFKFQIKDATGTVVGPDANPVTFTATYAGTTSNPVDESTLTGTPTTGTTFTWTGTKYQYNWKSPGQSGTLWLITATFANGQTIQVTIGLR